MFPLFKYNLVWFGASIHSGDREFEVPKDYPLYASGCRVDEATGRKYIRVKGVRWFTNLDYPQLHEDLILYKTYTPEEYPHYDNYDAIEVSKTSDIPMDYNGVMGVPITFLDKYNPEQFEIVGLTSGRDEFECRPTKRYTNPLQINIDGTESNGSKATTRSTILYDTTPVNTIYYTADNADRPFRITYARILIRRRH